jgi:hypothetical protein
MLDNSTGSLDMFSGAVAAYRPGRVRPGLVDRALAHLESGLRNSPAARCAAGEPHRC